jgi:hypothetical protein
MAMTATSAAQSIPWRTRVRVVTDSGTIDGRIESVDSLNLRVRVKDDYVSVRRSAVSSVLRHGTLGEKGVKMGAIGGAVIGGVMIGGLAGGMCEGDNCGEDALLGAAVGWGCRNAWWRRDRRSYRVHVHEVDANARAIRSALRRRTRPMTRRSYRRP